MTQPFIGEIKTVGFNFAPTNYAACDGQILSIAQNTALFSILGTTYGGNGQTTFALPNMQANSPMHPGTGAGLSTYDLGEVGGVPSVTLTESQLPSHNHALNSATLTPANAAQNVGVPTSTALLGLSAPGMAYADAATPAVAMAPNAILPTGGSQPHANQQPYLVIMFVIALYGIFPSRN